MSDASFGAQVDFASAVARAADFSSAMACAADMSRIPISVSSSVVDGAMKMSRDRG